MRLVRWLVYRVRRPQPEPATTYRDHWDAYQAAYVEQLARLGGPMRRHWP